MKMCSISVEPIPSRILIPVRSRHASQVAAGSVSPAETQTRRLAASPGCIAASMARNAVGAVKQTVGRSTRNAASRCSGEACSSSRLAAPTRSGNSTAPPRPKVKASGALPVNRSSARGRSTRAP